MMKRCLLVMGALALMISAMAAATNREGGDPPDETRPVQTVAEGLEADVTAYAAEHGVSLEEAVKRHSHRPELMGLAEAIRTQHSDVLAGMWLEHDPDYRLIVRTTEPSSDIATLAAKVALPVEIRPDADRSLKSTLLRLESELPALVDSVSGLDGVDVDERTGEVVLLTVGTSAGKSHPSADLEAARLRDEAGLGVRIETLQSASSDGHTYGGNDLTDCTAGFVVKNALGQAGYSTSAHCPDPQTFFEFGGGSYAMPDPPDGALKNNTTDLQWGRTSHWEYGEFYAHQTTSRRALTGQVFRSGSIVGDTVCHRGLTSGYSCGEITSVTFRPTYTNACGSMSCSAVWLRVAASGLDCQPGDSGGPVFFNNDAYGFYKGQNRTNGNCNFMIVMSSTYLGNLGVTYLYG